MSELRAFYKLEKELRLQIISGFLPDYHRIHPENVLAVRYGISRSSVRKALAHLEAEGLLFRQRGSGTFVAPAVERKVENENGKRGKMILYLSFSSLYSKKTFQGGSTFRLVYDGLSKVLTAAGYGFKAAHVGIEWQPPAELSDPDVAGIIFEGVVKKEFFDTYLAGRAVIGVNCYDPEFECSWVLEDSRRVAELSVKHLHSLGYRKIAILSDEASSPPMQDALLGYYTGLIRTGLPRNEKFVIYWDRDRVNGELCNEGLAKASFKPHLKELFASDDHPDAIICQDRHRADQTRIALESLNLNIPQDVGIMCSRTRSPLQHYDFNYDGFCARKHEVFVQAAKEIIEEIEHKTVVDHRVTYMSPELIKGNSLSNKNIDIQSKKGEL
ncbi:MAG: GntR family transcriptional regulator [Lentisphaeria bacterium]|nr:GntR family transcriptional regulator [Lentisphaeria bacterium]